MKFNTIKNYQHGRENSIILIMLIIHTSFYLGIANHRFLTVALLPEFCGVKLQCILRNIFALLGRYAGLIASSRCFGTIISPVFEGQAFHTTILLKNRKIGIDKSVTDCKSTLRNTQEERISHLQHGGSLISSITVLIWRNFIETKLLKIFNKNNRRPVRS
jgi:hypothetical protein